MNHDEKIHLAILDIMIAKGFEKISLINPPEEIINITGHGSKNIFSKMEGEVLLTNYLFMHEYEVTQIAGDFRQF